MLKSDEEKQRYKQYHRDYTKEYYELKKKYRNTVSIPFYKPTVPIALLPLTGTNKCCKAFGCGKMLTPRESLFGDYCFGCGAK